MTYASTGYRYRLGSTGEHAMLPTDWAAPHVTAAVHVATPDDAPIVDGTGSVHWDATNVFERGDDSLVRTERQTHNDGSHTYTVSVGGDHGATLYVDEGTAHAIADNIGGSDRLALDTIARVLDGNEWDADTIDTIANICRVSGRTVGDVAMDLP